MGHMWRGTQTQQRIPHIGCAHNKCGGEALSTTRWYINQVWMVSCSTSGSPVTKLLMTNLLMTKLLRIICLLKNAFLLVTAIEYDLTTTNILSKVEYLH